MSEMTSPAQMLFLCLLMTQPERRPGARSPQNLSLAGDGQADSLLLRGAAAMREHVSARRPQQHNKSLGTGASHTVDTTIAA